MTKSMMILCLLISVFVNSYSNSVPSAFWPQKDVALRSSGDSNTATKHLLIIGTKSDFKDKVINDLFDSLKKTESLFVRIDGTKKLSSYNVNTWKTILFVNTCMAWQMDNKVQSFIKKNRDYKAFISLTTSGDPKECGDVKKNPANVDAISSASVDEKRNEVVKELLIRIHNQLNK